jgi:hypothetical protein
LIKKSYVNIKNQEKITFSKVFDDTHLEMDLEDHGLTLYDSKKPGLSTLGVVVRVLWPCCAA